MEEFEIDLHDKQRRRTSTELLRRQILRRRLVATGWNSSLLLKVDKRRESRV